MTSPRHGSAVPLLDSVLDRLGREIIQGVLPEGKTFTLQDLSQRFDISRTVAREAMRALEQLGLVSSSRRVGITVQPRSSWVVFNESIIGWRLECEAERRGQLRSLNELRIGIEPVAARLCSEQASPADRIRLVQIAEELAELGHSGKGASEEFLELDIAFHSRLLEASGNEMFMALIPSVTSVLRGRTVFGLQPDNPEEETLDLHLRLALAIQSGDGAAAEKFSQKLLQEVREFLSPESH
ncbi:HTH-type transcriptional regulator LutR [Corynebacterium occultum]|uniref:HTH-type transcriptional regulator LutR n=1 Tax=Corynebacterium occultum TaxID=2675219 RepID=A0A6B8WP85_9CORY|nr:FadR/GntR family transcriptional regulator [Corynebacterium occultum]QGU08168.1 HTH-type transcriptional regulator LutR [Corynebacterium occultum]